LTLISLIGYPLSEMAGGGELYWGGKLGFVKDTVFTLIRNSFYGRSYFGGQEWAVFIIVAAAVLMFLIIIASSRGRAHLARLLPGLALLSLLGVTWAASSLRHLLLNSPYLYGRTALFYIPIFTLFLVFLATHSSAPRTFAKTASASVLGILAILSACHFVACANAKATQEWRLDAATKGMLVDLETIRRRDFPPAARIVLAADWRVLQTLQFYRQRDGLTWLTLREDPPSDRCAFYYSPDFAIPAGLKPFLVILKTYRTSGTTLAKLTLRPSADLDNENGAAGGLSAARASGLPPAGMARL
jgi:hypothetical protein